jgi:uncharacterized protein YcbK (DUF882 family)
VKLTEHFDSAEFTSHDGQVPSPSYLASARELCRDYLEPLRREFGACKVISGYRSVEQNRAVGGAPASMHLSRRGRAGAAADVSFARGTPRDWYVAAEKLLPGGLGRYDSHLHIDNRRGYARW